MKTKTFVSFALGFFAVALIAFSLWASPQKKLNEPTAAAVEQAALTPADNLPMPAATEFAPRLVAIVQSSPGRLVALIAASALAVMLVHHRFSRRYGNLVTAINTLPANVGFSKLKRRYLASGAIGTRYLFVKAGADDEHTALVTATADKPIGVASDDPAAAEDPVSVELSGINGQTLPLVAGGVINTLNADMFMSAAGKVTIKPTAAGTYWKVGRNLTLAGAANDPVEVQLCEPRKLVVLAAMTQVAGDIADTNSTAVNPTKADFDSLLVAAGKLQADYNLLVTALASGADIDFATT